ncbi:MAG: MATE family efflux transporter [bacterium]
MFNTMKYVKQDMIQGDIPTFKKSAKEVMKIVWPSMLEAFLVALTVLLDGIMVADIIGKDANTGISLVKQIVLLQISLITVISICMTAVIARRRGENAPEKANKAMHQGIQFAFLMSVFVAVAFGMFSTQLATLMASADTSSSVIEMGATYLQVMSLGFVFNALRLVINTGQRSIGNTKISLITNVAAALTNLGLNFLLIPTMGIAGGALATVLSNGMALLISIIAIIPKKSFLHLNMKYLFKFDLESFNVFKKLFPGAFIDQMLLRAGFLILAFIINNLGEQATYVNGLCIDVNSLVFTLADGFAIGTSAIIGRKLGEKRKDHAIVYSRVSMTLSVFISVVVGVVMIFVRPLLLQLYDCPPEDFALAQNVLIIATLTVVPQNIQWVITGILRGSGDTKFTAMTSFISIVIMRPAITYLLCYTFGLGLYGSWFGMLADQTIRCLANVWRYKSGIWLHIKV